MKRREVGHSSLISETSDQLSDSVRLTWIEMCERFIE
jgi:hypothetical protein